MSMDFDANNSSIDVIRERVLGETYFGSIYSGVNSKW